MQKTVVAIGKFDGVHIAHRELLQTAADIAKKNNYKSLGLIISSDRAPMILPPDRRKKEMLSLGLDMIHVQSLSEEFMSMSAETFADKVLIEKFNCAHAVVGYNFRFARGRCADASYLSGLCAERGMGCTVIEKITCSLESGEADASSSNIRSLLSDGDVKNAAVILGRTYSIQGEVMHGKKIGRTIGFPTANLKFDERLILPKTGVYATRVITDGYEYPSITNIGENPTVNKNGNTTVETNIIGFDGDIYGKEITVEFAERIRDEKKFADLTELKKQINSDIEFVSSNVEILTK